MMRPGTPLRTFGPAAQIKNANSHLKKVIQVFSSMSPAAWYSFLIIFKESIFSMKTVKLTRLIRRQSQQLCQLKQTVRLDVIRRD